MKIIIFIRLFRLLSLILSLTLVADLRAQAVGNIVEIFKPLRVGQSVSVIEGQRRIEITVMDSVEVGTHLVSELSASHIAVQDIAKISKTWVPIKSI
jgi:hypothetical protein